MQTTLRIFVLTVLLAPMFWHSNAQTIQLGAGTGESWNQDASPVNIYFRRFVQQFVYTPAELNAAFASNVNPITEIGFYVTESPIYSIPGYTIKFKHVAATDVSAALGTTGWTTVKTAFTYSPTAGGYDMISLDTPFLWDGTSSIAVEICCSRVNPTWNASGSVRIYGNANGFRFSRTDAGGSSCGSTPTVVRNVKPQAQLVFVPGTSTTWTGAVSTDWFNHSNWTAGVPNRIMDAVIPSGPTNMPEVQSAAAVAKDVTIQNGASLTFPANDSLLVYGDWDCSGTFNAGTSTVIFSGFDPAANQAGGGTQTFHNLEVRSSNGLTLTSGAFNVTGAMRLRGGTFTSNGRLTLVSNATETGNLGRVSNACSYTLQMTDAFGDGWNGGYVTLLVDGNAVESYSASGTGSTATIDIPNGASFSLQYTGGDYEGENSYVLRDPSNTVLYSSGTNPATGVVYTGTSSCAFSSSYSGDLTVQRYLDIPNDGWREMTAGVSGETLKDWENDGIIMTNFPGSAFPNFGWTSVYTYEENNANGVKNDGWQEATNITNALDPQNGHRVYIGTGTYTTSIAGPPLTGDQNFTLDYQNSTAGEIAAGEDQKGWNLIGNPYACSVDWDAIPGADKVNMDDAYWVWSASAGNYGLYQGGTGAGTNGVGQFIPSGQALWVHATSVGASLQISEADKVEENPTFVKSIQPGDFLRVQLVSNATSYHDEALIAFRNNAIEALDVYDGVKLRTHVLEAPEVFFTTNGLEELSISAVPDQFDELHLPLSVKTGLPGSYILKFKGIQNFNLSCAILEDTYTQTLIDLNDTEGYSYYQDVAGTENRFILHLGTSNFPTTICEPSNIATNINEKVFDYSLYPNPANTQVTISSDLRIDQIQVLDMSGKLVYNEENNQGGNQTLDINDWANGVYVLRLTSGDQQVIERLVVQH